MFLLNQAKTLLLANKESLVVAGDLIIKCAKKNHTNIIPIDSEHHSLWKCLQPFKVGEVLNSKIKKLTITASGGPFLHMPLEQLQSITVEQALCHPVWNMGEKISIDSATMANKGLEMIECYHLFGIDEKKIDAIIHPQSVIHGMVDLPFGVLSYLSDADMRLCISDALDIQTSVDKNLFSQSFDFFFNL